MSWIPSPQHEHASRYLPTNSWYGTPKGKNPERDPARCTPLTLAKPTVTLHFHIFSTKRHQHIEEPESNRQQAENKNEESRVLPHADNNKKGGCEPIRAGVLRLRLPKTSLENKMHILRTHTHTHITPHRSTTLPPNTANRVASTITIDTTRDHPTLPSLARTVSGL